MLIYYYTLELYRKGKLVKEFPDRFWTEGEANLFAKTYLKTRRKKTLSIKRIEHKMLSLDKGIEIPKLIEEKFIELPEEGL